MTWILTADSLPPRGERVLIETHLHMPSLVDGGGCIEPAKTLVMHDVAEWTGERWRNDNWHRETEREHVHRWMRIPE